MIRLVHIETRWRHVSTYLSGHRGHIGDGNCVGHMVCFHWLSMHFPYLYVIGAYVHFKDDHKWLERVEWTRGLLSHFAMYGYCGRIVFVSCL